MQPKYIFYERKHNMLSEERINANYLMFINKLQKYNCYSEEMMNEMGERIKNASYSLSLDFGGAYRGGLIDITLNVLCKVGYMLNNNCMGATNGFPLLSVNNDMLMRVLLLVNIAKADMFTIQTNEYKRKNGMPYEFVDTRTKLKIGERSLFLCQKYGIKLEEDEFEAFLSLDREDDKGERFNSPLFTMVKATKMFTLVQIHQKYLDDKNN